MIIFYATCILFAIWQEKEEFLWMVQIIKFSDAYASNVSRCAGNNDGNISDIKSHDSHVMMQYLLSVIIRGYLGSDVQTVLIELGVFF